MQLLPIIKNTLRTIEHAIHDFIDWVEAGVMWVVNKIVYLWQHLDKSGITASVHNVWLHIKELVSISGIPALLSYLCKKTRRFFRRTDAIIFMLCIVIFMMFPSIDLKVSNLFYDSNIHQFVGKQSTLAEVIYFLFANIPLILLIALPLLIFRGVRQYKKGNLKRARTCLFLLACLITGPGLLVNTVIKNHSIGRERPSQIVNFGGHGTFTSAFSYSGECKKNCSFVSGHAAMGFFFIVLGWILASRKWFYFGFSLGVIVGFVRITQGGHFLSDVTFAFWSVYWVTCIMGLLFNIKNPFSKKHRSKRPFIQLQPMHSSLP